MYMYIGNAIIYSIYIHQHHYMYRTMLLYDVAFNSN